MNVMNVMNIISFMVLYLSENNKQTQFASVLPYFLLVPFTLLSSAATWIPSWCWLPTDILPWNIPSSTSSSLVLPIRSKWPAHLFLLHFIHFTVAGWYSSVGIVVRYGLECPGVKSRWRRDFLHPSRPALVSTQPSIQWVQGLSRG
jgi:hypothetical protein